MSNDSNDSADSARIEADIGLLTDYLACELPPEGVAEVRWRLEMDREFLALAAPFDVVLECFSTHSSHSSLEGTRGERPALGGALQAFRHSRHSEINHDRRF